MRIAAAFAAALAVAGCGSGDASYDPAAKAAAEARAEQAIDALAGALQRELKSALEAGGPSGAVSVCSERAPAVAAGLAQDGLTVRRTSLKWRNPANAPDAFETTVLDAWEREGRAETVSAVVDGPQGRELRFLRPIRVQPMCVACHGGADTLIPDVRDEVARRYPEDRATGFKDGDLRGAFSVRVRMSK